MRVMLRREEFNPATFQPLEASILLVDDRPAHLLALEAVLKPLGHRLVPAHSGEEALKHLLEEEFAVILMDVQMPGLDGYQTVALIKQRERCRQVPDLFLKEQQIKIDQERLRLAEQQAQARRSEERFRNLTESMPLCVWATDTAGGVQYCNRAWLEYSGMSAEQSAGLGVMQAIHPEQRDRVELAWSDSLRAGRAFGMEFLLQDREGGERWPMCRAVP